MKTKTLIKLLQEADPSGELECNAGLKDIFFVERLPYFYDGIAQVLIRDESRTDYNVIGAKFNIEDKICIVTHSIEDAMLDHPNLPVEYPNEYAARYKGRVEKWRQEALDINKEVDEWMKTKLTDKDSTDKFFKTTEHKL